MGYTNLTKRTYELGLALHASSTPTHDSYWRLKAPNPSFTVPRLKGILESRGYATGQITDKKWLQDSLFRADLGLMSYVPYSNDELREFIEARRIAARHDDDGKIRGRRMDLVLLLDCQDQQPDFHRFLDLPAELRNRIYRMYFDSLEEPQLAPSQPPLTVANRQLRSETLPMFYAWLRLPVQLSCRDGSSMLRMGRLRTSIYIPDKIELFFRNTRPENLTLIRRFRFSVREDFDVRRPWAAPFNAMTAFEIDLPEDGHGFRRLRFAQGPWQGITSNFNLLRTAWRLRVRMRAWAHCLQYKDGHLMLDIDNIADVRKIMERLWWRG